LPVPGTTLALAERPILPVFLPPSASKDATPWTILSWGSALLHGMSRSLRHRSLDRRHLSWGSTPLQRTGRRESTSDFRRLPGFAGVSVHGSHPADYGVARRFSQPLSDLLPLSTVPPFSGGWRPCGSPSRGLFLPRSSADSSSCGYPLDVAPAGCAAPVPRRGHPKARRKLPRSIRPPSLIVYRVFILVEIDRTLEPLFTVDLSDLPLLGFHLLMVFTRATGEGFPPLER
jgi:hypothetical protein